MKIKYLNCDRSKWVTEKVIRIEIETYPDFPEVVFFNCYRPNGDVFVISDPNDIEYIIAD